MDDSLSDSEIPTRRRTSRKAAERSKNKMSKMISDANKHSKPDIEMEDSDNDESWKPSEADKQTEIEEEGHKEEVADECRELQIYSGSKRGRRSSTEKTKSSSKSIHPLSGTETKVIPSEQPLTNGDFVLLKEDMDRENAPLWRFDCHGTVQKYNPLKSQAGNYLHKSSNVFSGYIPSDRDKFVSVAIKYVHLDANNYTVKRTDIPTQEMKSQEADALKRTSSAEEMPSKTQAIQSTTEYQEPFEIYIQALLSHSLDSNFLDDVINDKDLYFLDSIKTIQEVTRSKLNKAMANIKWPKSFMQATILRPMLSLKDVGSKKAKCGACEAIYTSFEMKLSGKAYNQENLKDKEESDDDIIEEFMVCSKCKIAVDIIHHMYHLKRKLFLVCEEVIDKRKEASPNLESASLLTELLANTSWLEEQFKKTQELWAKAETYVRH